MPRRLPVRPAVIIGNIFVVLITSIICFIYYVYMFVVWLPKARDDARVIVMLAIFNVIFFMLIWSFIQSMTTDPGQVPVFWGFHLGDPENKRRRYCLMCNIFKPERCHHCSSCNRCVLNMDHHCPWINNCIGFWNRKFFILLLIYVLIITYYIGISMGYAWLESIQWSLDVYYYSTKPKDEKILINNLMVQVAYMLNGTAGVLMTMFLRLHIRLALSNKTTIENLEMKGRPYTSLYDIGPKRNWEQIFGMNRWLWPFPIFGGSGKPLGDGIYWPTNRPEEEGSQSGSNKVGQSGNKRQNSVTSPERSQGSNQRGLTNQTKVGGNQNFGSGGQSYPSQNARQGAYGGNIAAQSQFSQNSVPGGGPVMHPNQRYAQQQQMYQDARNRVDPQYAAQYAAQAQQHQDLNQKIMENQQRAVQLHQQINKQKASQQARPKQQRGPALSGQSQGSANSRQAPAKKQRNVPSAGGRRD